MKITVVKRNGETEKFSTEKIERVVKAAGLTDEKASKLVKAVSSWIKDQGISTIDSLQIRDKVIEELKKLDTYSANMFMWYQKTKE